MKTKISWSAWDKMFMDLWVLLLLMALDCKFKTDSMLRRRISKGGTKEEEEKDEEYKQVCSKGALACMASLAGYPTMVWDALSLLLSPWSLRNCLRTPLHYFHLRKLSLHWKAEQLAAEGLPKVLWMLGPRHLTSARVSPPLKPLSSFLEPRMYWI